MRYMDMIDCTKSITESCMEWFDFCPNVTSTFRKTVIFKSFHKQNNVSK
jgi:hypothetical protein